MVQQALRDARCVRKVLDSGADTWRGHPPQIRSIWFHVYSGRTWIPDTVSASALTFLRLAAHTLRWQLLDEFDTCIRFLLSILEGSYKEVI